MHDLSKKKENKVHMKWSEFKKLSEEALKEVFKKYDVITVHTINGVFIKMTEAEL